MKCFMKIVKASCRAGTLPSNDACDDTGQIVDMTRLTSVISHQTYRRVSHVMSS